MKKTAGILSTLIIFIVSCFSLSACGDGQKTDAFVTGARAAEGGGVIISLSDGGEIFCAAEGGVLALPDEHEKYNIVGIDGGAFSGCTLLKGVTLPDSVESVGEGAFLDCSALESVAFGDAIKEIGRGAFSGCESLKKVYAPSAEKWCGISFADTGANPMYFAGEFYAGGSLVKSLEINGVDGIPAYAFYGCSNIADVKVGADVKKIGENAFYGCENLESAEIGAESIGELAFADCDNLKTLTLTAGLREIGGYAFTRCTAFSTLVLPNGVKLVGECAFSECAGISEVRLNEGLEEIGDGAFAGCASITEFNLPSTVGKIGYGMLMFSESYGFGETGEMKNCVSRVTLSDKITEIPDYAFSYCGITVLTVGEKVEKIAYSAFYGCNSLESVVLPAGIKKIESYAFYKCPLLKKVYFKGTSTQWEGVSIGKNGNDIKSADVYFYSEKSPVTLGKFWHYGEDGIPVAW